MTEVFDFQHRGYEPYCDSLIRIPKSFADAIIAKAELDGTTFSQIVIECIENSFTPTLPLAKVDEFKHPKTP